MSETRTYTYTVIITPDPESPGWWNAEVPALTGCLSCGQSFEETLSKIKVAAQGERKWWSTS